MYGAGAKSSIELAVLPYSLTWYVLRSGLKME